MRKWFCSPNKSAILLNKSDIIKKMDISVRGFCCRTIEKIKSSPIGVYAIPYIDEFSKATKTKLTFKIIEEKLKKSEYLTLQEWYSELRLMLSETAKAAASRTDFGLVCQTLLQLAEDEITEQGFDVRASDKIPYNKRRITPKIDQVCEFLPNSAENLESSIADLPLVRSNPYTPNRDKYPVFNPDNISDLYRELYRLGTDEEVQSVFRIAKTFEKFQIKKEIISLDLSKMSPFTLAIIKKQIKKGLPEGRR